jgi:hypothetical protein
MARLHMQRPPKSSNGEYAAILLVHRRPANIDMQVRAALCAPSVGEVVVSCNNPKVKLKDWIGVSSPRLRLIEDEGRNQTRRYDVALDTGADRLVLPDDDVLLTPDALDAFCRSLPADGSYPIGMAGQRVSARGVWESAIDFDGEEVDVLNRAYVCTREHAANVFRNADLLGWSEEERFSFPADDVLLSFGGETCPRIVEVEHVNCISHSHSAIATYRQADFHESRTEWVNGLRKVLERDPARRDLGLKGAVPVPRSAAGRAINEVMRPARRRFYRGFETRTWALTPKKFQQVAGLDDYRCLFSPRVQLGTAPAPLLGYIKIDDHQRVPQLTSFSPLWNPEFRGDYATEVVAFDVLDRLAPTLVPLALAAWRGMMRTGSRLIVGVRDSSATLAERDAKIGARTWASQLPNATEPLTSPLQLPRQLPGTLWDEQRLRDALEGQGFDCVATIRDAQEIEAHPAVSPWIIHDDNGEEMLAPVPPVLDGAADIIVIARAR